MTSRDVPSRAQLLQRIPADLCRSYVAQPTFRYAAFLMLMAKYGWLDEESAASFCAVDKAVNGIIDNVPQLLAVDFASLRLDDPLP